MMAAWHARLTRLCVLLTAAGLAGAPSRAADPVNGKQLHDERCLFCHGVENYQQERSKIKSLRGLREAVQRWEDEIKDPFTPLEREDVVEYLNRNFYKFPQQREVGLIKHH